MTHTENSFIFRCSKITTEIVFSTENLWLMLEAPRSSHTVYVSTCSSSINNLNVVWFLKELHVSHTHTVLQDLAHYGKFNQSPFGLHSPTILSNQTLLHSVDQSYFELQSLSRLWLQTTTNQPCEQLKYEENIQTKSPWQQLMCHTESCAFRCGSGFRIWLIDTSVQG